jgi:hypothetical protein
MQQESQHNNWERVVKIIPKKKKTKGHLSIELSGLFKKWLFYLI